MTPWDFDISKFVTTLTLRSMLIFFRAFNPIAMPKCYASRARLGGRSKRAGRRVKKGWTEGQKGLDGGSKRAGSPIDSRHPRLIIGRGSKHRSTQSSSSTGGTSTDSQPPARVRAPRSEGCLIPGGRGARSRHN